MREQSEARTGGRPRLNPPDVDVVERVRAGDAALFELLMRRHNRTVYRTIRSILRDEAEVEDAMQDAYVSAFEHLDQFKGQSAFSTWIVRIAINTALARVRARGRLTLVSSDAWEGEAMSEPVEAPGPERQASSREAAAILESALDAIPELYRTTFVLREVEQLDTAETAAVLGVADDVVKTRLYRARLALREKLLEVVGDAAAEAFDFQAPRCDRVARAVLARIGVPTDG